MQQKTQDRQVSGPQVIAARKDAGDGMNERRPAPEARSTKLVLPTANSGDASVSFGLPPGTISWKEIDRRLREGHGTLPRGASLAKLVAELGLSDTEAGK